MECKFIILFKFSKTIQITLMELYFGGISYFVPSSISMTLIEVA
jgi:hypothetical protein